MDPSARNPEAPGAVTAALTYLVDTGVKPVNYPSVAGEDGVSRWDSRHEDRAVAIHDGRAAAEPFDLDRQGFTLVRHDTAVTDFYDDAEIETVYEAEVEKLVKEVTGARRVVVFDHTRRSDSVALRGAKGIREPAGNVHNDYTARSAPQRVRDLLPAGEAEALLQRRFAIVNVWRPIRGPVRTAPLALCDARSVAPEDLIAAERRAKDRVGEIQQAVFNPAHRWTYFPNMERHEAVLIKVYDSAEDGRARFTIHTAFDDPTSPPDAPPRESIETRTFVFF
ncbi:MAG: methyltransferase [Proteobacteria bacterium]|nr:methyltransferase [Pseudomonadota bacterium]